MISREFYERCKQTAELESMELAFLIRLEKPELAEVRLRDVADQNHGSTVLMAKDFAVKAPYGVRSIRGVFNELNVLTALEGSGFSVPKITSVGKNAFYFLMTKLKGDHLHDAADLTEKQADHLASDIAQFKIGLEKYASEHPEKFLAIKKKKFLRLNIVSKIATALKNIDLHEEISNNAKEFLKTMLSYMDELPKRDLVFVHHDLHSHNIVLDRAKRLSGGLDFAESCFSLPEADFDFSLNMSYGQDISASRAFKHKIAEKYAELAGIDASAFKRKAICFDALEEIYKSTDWASFPVDKIPMDKEHVYRFVYRLERASDLCELSCAPSVSGVFKREKPPKL